jgi:hypothetical protein
VTVRRTTGRRGGRPAPGPGRRILPLGRCHLWAQAPSRPPTGASMPASPACRWQACKQANSGENVWPWSSGRHPTRLRMSSVIGCPRHRTCPASGSRTPRMIRGRWSCRRCWARRTEHLPLGHGEGEIIEGDQVVIAAGKALQLEHVVLLTPLSHRISGLRRTLAARIIASISAGSTLSSDVWMRALAVSSAPKG